ncbi:MAG: G5 domain-containing protein [Eubacteriales bacterium]|nr:G5 domain-containing protein [Eubacteriales bacterium]
MAKKRIVKMLALLGVATTLVTTALPVQAAGTKTETLKRAVPGYGYDINIQVEMDQEKKTIVSLEDKGAVNNDGRPLTSGYSYDLWIKAWEGMKDQLIGKTKAEIEQVDGISTATVSSDALRELVVNALDQLDSTVAPETGNYLQPLQAKMPFNKEVTFQLDVTQVPQGSDYYLKEEYYTEPGKEERKAYYSSEFGKLDLKAGTYTVQKPAAGSLKRLVFEDKNGRLPQIEIRLEIVESISLENGKLTSTTVDIEDLVASLSSVRVREEDKSYASTYYQSTTAIFRPDGYVNTGAKDGNHNRPVFTDGKKYFIALDSRSYGTLVFEFTADSSLVPKTAVEDSQLVLTPATAEFATGVTLAVEAPELKGAKFIATRVVDPSGNELPTNGAYGKPSFNNHRQGITISRPLPGTYTLHLADERGMYADVTRTFEVTPVLSIEADTIVSSSERLVVDSYIGSYNDIVITNVTTGEVHTFSSQYGYGQAKPVSRDGKIDKLFKKDGKLLFNATDDFTVTVLNGSYSNPALAYKPTGFKLVEQESLLEELKYQVIEEKDDSLYEGVKETKVKGQNGKRVSVHSYLEVDGVKQEGTEKDEERTIDPVNEIVKVGTKVKKQGWVEVDGDYYYFIDDVEQKNKWFENSYAGADGKMMKDTFTPDGYRVDAKGKWVTGAWVEDRKGWKYVFKDGYFYQDGWTTVSEKRFHFKKDGYLSVSTWIKNEYVDHNGFVLKNTTTPDGYRVDADGQWIKANWKKSGKKWILVYADGFSPKKQWQKEEKYWYYFDEKGHMAESRWVGNFYVDAYGHMLTSTWTPDGYYVRADGLWDKTKARRTVR